MQQAIRTIRQPIQSTLALPGSENIASHAILLASLATGVSDISGVPDNGNIHALITALGQLGIAIQQDKQANSCIIAGACGQFPKKLGPHCHSGLRRSSALGIV